MQINITYDSSVANAPAGFKTAVQAAVQYFENLFSVPITVNIDVGWGEVGGQSLNGGVGASLSSGIILNYNDIRAALWADARTPDALTAAMSLPAADPTNGGTFFMSSAEAKALGLLPPDDTQSDGSIGLDSSTQYTFDPNNRAVPGLVDAIGVIEHEISEVLGRESFLGFQPGDGSRLFGVLDLFRYQSAGVLAPTSGNGSFSINGQTLLMPFDNPSNGGDSGDWSQSVSGDAFDAFGDTGIQEQVSAVDLRLLDVLGFRGAPMPTTPTPNVAPSNQITITADTQIQQGQTYYFNNSSGFLLDGSNVPQAPSLTNSGTIVVHGGEAVGDGWGSFYTGSVFSNTATGQVYDIAENGNASTVYGFFSGSWSSSVSNAGLIQVVSPSGSAEGIVMWVLSGNTTFNNTGTITVWSDKDAIGVNFPNGGPLNNSGIITVTGGSSAIGVYAAKSFANNGTLEATSLSATVPSIAVDIPYSAGSTYTNAGTIIGDYAFLVDESSLTPPFEPDVDIVNSGKIVGAISLANGKNQIHNTGIIGGFISFENNDSIYDGANGHLYGAIYLGHASNAVTLGSDDGEVYGGGGSDTITGGSGNDFFEIARGNNAVDGGGGFNTLSLADSAASYVVDLGNGSATGAGVTTLKNIQQVIGSNFNDVLKAGASAATLIAGSGKATLIGGAGNDTLVAGTGGDTMTGGGGSDDFIYSAGDQQLVITDFGNAGNNDVLTIYGYASPSSVLQQGGDTLITLPNGDSVLLKNVQLSSLNSSNVLYNTNPYPGPLVPPSLPVFGTSPIDFNYDLKIYSSETLNLVLGASDAGYGFQDDGYSSPSQSLRSLDNFGSVHVSAAGLSSIVGLLCDGSAPSGTLTNEAGATFSIANPGGEATGTFSGDWSPAIMNAGNFTVTASGTAYGVQSWQDGLQFTNAASGAYAVSSSGNASYGLYLNNGGAIENDGQMTASGAVKVYGIYVDRAETGPIVNGTMPAGSSIINKGSIVATGQTGTKTYGIAISGLDIAARSCTIVNSGLISAQTAILDFQYGYSPSQATSVHITNSGMIYGDIDLGGSTCSIANTGTIVGNILLHDDNNFVDSGNSGDMVDLRGGTFSGYIAISAGLNLGNSSVHDVIYTGSGNTLIKIAGGESKLTTTITGGAGGNTTVQFDEASNLATITHNADGSWTVSAGSDGVETLINVQALRFTDTTITLGTTLAVHGDFNGDGRSDFLMQSDYGRAGIWLMNGSTATSGGPIDPNPGTAWNAKAGADFNGDGKSDILWQNADGSIAIWFMNGTTITSGALAGFNPGPSWQIVGSGDFNGDGKADILFQNADGTPAIWLMNGTTISSGAALLNPGTSWRVIGSGDFNGDGKSDILWQNIDGTPAIWLMNGTSLVSGATLTNPGTSWHLKAAGDFNGDGKSDLLWQNDDGAVAVWLMNGTSFVSGALVGPNPGSSWHAIGAGDFNGDGKADILWQNVDGTPAVWLMNGTNFVSGAALANPGSQWHVVAMGG